MFDFWSKGSHDLHLLSVEESMALLISGVCLGKAIKALQIPPPMSRTSIPTDADCGGSVNCRGRVSVSLMSE